MAIYETIRKSFVAPLIRLIFRVKLRGYENEPKNGPMVICSNHQSNLDPIVLGACVRRPIRYMAKKSLFKIPIIKNLVKAFGAFPVDRGGGDVTAIKTTISLLEHGEAVGIFMQGHRVTGRDPRYSKVMNGAAVAAFRAKCGVLPVAMTVKNYRLLPARRTIVNIGKFLPYESLPFGDPDSPDYRAVSEMIFLNICDMIEDEAWR